MATTPSDGGHVRGDVDPRTKSHATFEFKAHDPSNTGGGYPRWRSTEYRAHTPGDRREDAYVPVHRLAAVAWLFDGGVTAEQILASGALAGVDVHHELGMPSATVESELSLCDHGTHSEITQAQVRAWGADAKRRATGDRSDDSAGDRCGRCGDDADVLCTSDGFDGVRCVECARLDAGGDPIEVGQS